MKILFHAQQFCTDTSFWLNELQWHLQDFEIKVYPDLGNLQEIEYAVVWKAPHGLLKQCSNLKAILSLGAGVDHLLEDPELPQSVPIVRLVDENLCQQMGQYALHWVLHFHSNYFRYREQQHRQCWQALPYVPPQEKTIGILGLGTIGKKVAYTLQRQGFKVIGWGGRERTGNALHPMIDYFYSKAQLSDFLQQSDILVNILPLTSETSQLIRTQQLQSLPQGAFIINIGRGGIIDEVALLEALNSQQITAIAFDVFAEEPLPQESPLWQHPAVYITPHIAGQSHPQTACKVIAENIKRIHNNQKPHPIYNSKLGY